MKVLCLLALFIVIFDNGLGPRTDFASWNAVINVIPLATEAVPGKSECS
jgi:hypothetical protein